MGVSRLDKPNNRTPDGRVLDPGTTERETTRQKGKGGQKTTPVELDLTRGPSPGDTLVE